jgi:dihydroorotase-like cyclic amidohydrolase
MSFWCAFGSAFFEVMFEYYKKGKISLEKVVEKMCHNPAILFEIEKRGFVKEGYKADLVIINPNAENTVSKESSTNVAGVRLKMKFFIQKLHILSLMEI